MRRRRGRWPLRPDWSNQEVETELATLTKVLPPAHDWSPIVEEIKITAGYEQALGAALGDDLDAASDETAPSHWRAITGDGGSGVAGRGDAAQPIRQRAEGAPPAGSPRSAWSRPGAVASSRPCSRRVSGWCLRRAICGAGTATASRPARRARPARAWSSAAAWRRSRSKLPRRRPMPPKPRPSCKRRVPRPKPPNTKPRLCARRQRRRMPSSTARAMPSPQPSTRRNWAARRSARWSKRWCAPGLPTHEAEEHGAKVAAASAQARLARGSGSGARSRAKQGGVKVARPRRVPKPRSKASSARCNMRQERMEAIAAEEELWRKRIDNAREQIAHLARARGRDQRRSGRARQPARRDRAAPHQAVRRHCCRRTRARQGGRRSRGGRDGAEGTREGVARGAGAARRGARGPRPQRGAARIRARAAGRNARKRSAISSIARRKPVSSLRD